MYKLVAFLVAGTLITSPGGLFGRTMLSYSDTSTLTCLQKAARQLDEALLLMQNHYYKKDAVNWDTLISAARTRLVKANSCEDAYQTLNWCFQELKEKHSFIMPQPQAALYNYDTARLHQKPHISQLVGEIRGELMADKGIAYLNVPWIGTTDQAICSKIADSLQQLIAELDRNGISKWIIDLRKNTGGNCWPMLAGIGPLLNNGICGYFISGNEKVPFSYENGAALHGKHIRCQTSSKGYRTKADKKWIVVLTGPHTSSSGEIIALAFKGRDQVYLYGEPTAGFTTANTTYTLSDNSMLVLTVCTEADRNGNLCDGKIVPDQFISSKANSVVDDPVKNAAVMWLHIQ